MLVLTNNLQGDYYKYFPKFKYQKNKDSNKGDYKNGNTRDNSKTHTKSGQCRSGGRGNNGGRR